MDDDMKISDQRNTLNGIISELESIEVHIDVEDKLLRLMLSFPCSYQTCFNVWEGNFVL